MRRILVALLIVFLYSFDTALADQTDLEQAESKSKKYLGSGFQLYKNFCVCLDGSIERHKKLGIITSQGASGSPKTITVQCGVLRFDPATDQETGTDFCASTWVPLAK